MSDPTTPPPWRVTVIRARLDDLAAEEQALYEELDAYRVKCPTCICRIVPGEGCSCCDDVALLPEELEP